MRVRSGAAWPCGVFQGDVPDKCPVCPHHSCPAIVEPWIIFFSRYSIKFHITYSIFSPAPTIEESHNIFHTKLFPEEILPIINNDD